MYRSDSAAPGQGASRVWVVDGCVARARAAAGRLQDDTAECANLAPRAANAAARLAASLDHAADMLHVNSVRSRLAGEALSRAEMLASVAEQRTGAVLRAGGTSKRGADAVEENNALGSTAAADGSVHDLETAAAQAAALCSLLQSLPDAAGARERLQSEEAPESVAVVLPWLVEAAGLAPDAQSMPWLQFTDTLAATDAAAAAAVDALRHELDPVGEGRASLPRLVQLARECGSNEGTVSPAALAGALRRAADLARPDVVSPISGKAAAAEALRGRQAGDFIVRFSRSRPGAFAASYVADDGSCEHLLLRPHRDGGLVTQGGAAYPSLRRALLAHPRCLRCARRVPHSAAEPEYRCVGLLIVMESERDSVGGDGRRACLVTLISGPWSPRSGLHGEVDFSTAAARLASAPAGAYLMRLSQSSPGTLVFAFATDEQPRVRQVQLRTVPDGLVVAGGDTSAVFDHVEHFLRVHARALQSPLPPPEPEREGDRKEEEEGGVKAAPTKAVHVPGREGEGNAPWGKGEDSPVQAKPLRTVPPRSSPPPPARAKRRSPGDADPVGETGAGDSLYCAALGSVAAAAGAAAAPPVMARRATDPAGGNGGEARVRRQVSGGSSAKQQWQ